MHFWDILPYICVLLLFGAALIGLREFFKTHSWRRAVALGLCIGGFIEASALIYMLATLHKF